MFSREDYTIFRNLSTITHKAGVPLKHLRRLVIKELVDNSLDANPGHKCEIVQIDDDTYSITDSGPGIPGEPAEIATLFSIRRPLTSSKILRRPSRGALGNGLRVVSGTILASGGSLIVCTRGVEIGINLLDDGTSIVKHRKPSPVKGTRVIIQFGESVPRDKHAMIWGKWANEFAQALIYTGKSNPWWYDSDSFYELMMAAGEMDVEDLILQFDGVIFDRCDIILQNLPLKAAKYNRDTADELLSRLRFEAPKIDPKKIGRIVDKPRDINAYHRVMGTITIEPGRGEHSAVLPYVVEAIAIPLSKDVEDDILFPSVNGTPITGEMYIRRTGKTEISMFGCGVSHKINRVSTRKFQLELNVTIPYMPITTDGKAPDFARFLSEIYEVTQKSTRKLKTEISRGNAVSDVLSRNLKVAIQKASGNGQYRFSLRQLYYAIRPFVMEQCTENPNLDYAYFGRFITQVEAELGKDIPGMYRDPRGVLYHPHTGDTIPIGTIAVEEYQRPEWTFKNVLYIEKEGLFEVLKQAKFPERYDICLLSSKGFASRAVRDLIDLLGEHDEEVNVFCVHDADGPGTVIYQALQEGTVARKARQIKIINLGIEPWEALEMGLQVEEFGQRKSKVPTATYVDREYSHKGIEPTHFNYKESDWSDWLQTRRVELNAMTSPQFLEWIEGKMKEYGVEKVLPPEQVIQQRYVDTVESTIRRELSNKILAAANLDDLVADKMKNVDVPKSIVTQVQGEIHNDPVQQWSGSLDEIARKAGQKQVK